MKTLILSIIICALTLNASAWQTFDEASKGLPEAKVVELIKSKPGKFYLTANHEGPGLSIFGYNQNNHTMVTIRKANGKYDFKISMYQSLFENEGDIYLTLLDKEGFELGSLFISKVGENFSGNLYHKYTDANDWDGFYDVASYEIHLRY